ncbi:M48 family metallopeptidase [Terrabacter sp. MAHUQ-38]|uniref:M48 family metallopeptidase n=1 Tax=unclassified Terrabacter TaxID=2630222 RepID=UPI002102E436|nr:M48 family metallopeptidase [Terrabacter sp. MAHUQ-38]
MRAQPMQVLPVAPGSHVPLRRHVRHPREILTLVIAIMVSLLLLLAAIAEVTVAIDQERAPDVYALALVFAPLLVWFARGQLWALQRLNGIKLTAEQFPEAHAMLVDAAGRSGMSYVPDAYVVLGNGVINAAASGHGFRRFVVVHSDLLEVGGAAREPDALRFVIAHEVGHIAAGHTSYWRILGTFASQWIPLVGSTLSRAQEYTADNYGHALVPHGARSAMATLAGGKYLGRSVDVDAMADRAVTEPGFFVWISNATGTHPVLLWRMHALRDRRRPGRLLWRPREPWLWGPAPAPGAYALPAMVGFSPTPMPEAALPDVPLPPALTPVSNPAVPVRRDGEGPECLAETHATRTDPTSPTREDERWRP